MFTYWQRIKDIVGPATIREFDQIGQPRTRDALEAFILDQSDATTRLLDAGCNTGVEGYRLFQRGFPGQYVGIDSNLKALTVALANLAGHPAAVLQADLATIPYPNQAFDLVLSKDVIEHWPDFTPILPELARLTRRWLVLSFFIRPHAAPDAIQRHPDGYYLNRYNRARLIRCLTDQGFQPPRVLFQEGEDEVWGCAR